MKKPERSDKCFFIAPEGRWVISFLSPVLQTEGARLSGEASVTTWLGQLRLEEYTNAEIAGRLPCSERTVERRLALIRGLWEEAAPA